MKNLLFKKWMLLVAFVFVGWVGWAQTATPPSAGDGTFDNPYQIATLDNLYWLSQTISAWGAGNNFIQTADIDATTTSAWDGGAGFTPIGSFYTNFYGIFDGQGYSITGIYINRPDENYQALFGFSHEEGTLKNINIRNASVTGKEDIGVLCGACHCAVENCSATGVVSGQAYVGGLLGFARESVLMSYANVAVTGSNICIGGLIGMIEWEISVINCYALGSVTATSASNVGGLIGRIQSDDKVYSSYSAGAVSSNNTNVGGLIGGTSGGSPIINDCYWDTQTSGQSTSAGGTGKNTSEMQTQSTYTNWDFDRIWAISAGNYPVLDIRSPVYSGGIGTVGSPYQIATIADLLSLETWPAHWSMHFIQTADINASGAEVSPIGNDSDPFTGSYNGQNFTVAHFTSIGETYVGFFGKASWATLTGISLTNLNVSGIYSIGGLAGYIKDVTVDNCFVSGHVSGILIGGGMVGYSESSSFNKCGADVVLTGDPFYGNDYNKHLGGFVGTVQIGSTFTNCYAKGSVSGFEIGGFVGGLDIFSSPIGDPPQPINPDMGFTLTNCYAANTLTVPEGGQKGGLYGQSTYAGSSITMTNSFWDKEIAGTTQGYLGGTGKTTAEMKTQTTFTDAGWDFTTTPIWVINSYDNNGYPYLEGQLFDYTYWDGSEGTSWNTPGNWDGNAVPDVTMNVRIPGTGITNYPVVGTGNSANCSDLIVEIGASLTVQSGGSLITAGTFNNHGTINLQRSASNGQYHFVSSPITNATANTFLGEYLLTWSEPTATWSNIENPATNLVVAKGYSLWGIAKGNQTYTFAGTPNTGDQSIAITYTEVPGSGFDGANLLGNPYTSSIDWSYLDDTYGAVYYWNGTAYQQWNNGAGAGSQYIPPMQGFFIVTAANGNFSLTNSCRTHTGATGFYKSGNEKTIENGLILQASNGSYHDELYLLFNDEASPDFELESDAWKLTSSTAGLSQIWSVCSDGNLSIDIRPGQGTIQLGFANDQTGNYSISLQEIAGLSKAILEDTKLNIFHNLQNEKYEFAWDKNDAETRFKLHLNSVGIEENQSNAGNLWISGNTLYIAAPKLSGQTGLVEVYNASGQKLMSKSIVLSEFSILELNFKGFVAARLTAGNEVITVKGVLR